MITSTNRKPENFICDLLVCFVRQVEEGYPECSSQFIEKQLKFAVDSGDFTGKEEEIFLFYPEPEAKLKTKRIMLVGLGKKELERETFRLAGGLVAGQALKTRTQNMLVVVPVDLDFPSDEISECLAEGLLLGVYRFRKYKTKIDEDEKG